MKIFRKIRQNLLDEGRLRKFGLYAIGEIFLIVVGILIALYINNANASRKNDASIDTILTDIQRDLSIDIMNASQIFDHFLKVDSIQYLILNDKLNYSDYKNDVVPYLVYNYEDFVMQINGYRSLMRNIDNIPPKYDRLHPQLNELYVYKKEDIEVFNQRIESKIYNNLDGIGKKSWFNDYLTGANNDDKINYFLNDFEYKNQVGLYMIDQSNVFGKSKNYKVDAVNLYHLINELLESDNDIPDHIKNNSSDETLINSILGKYELRENKGQTWAQKIEIGRNENQLFIEIEGVGKLNLYLHRDNIFHCKEYYMSFSFEREPPYSLRVSRNVYGYCYYMKTQ